MKLLLKPLLVGALVAVAYLGTNIWYNPQIAVPDTQWSYRVDAKPTWTYQAPIVAIFDVPYLELDDSYIDPIDVGRDPYLMAALSSSAQTLLRHIQRVYKVSHNDAVVIVSAVFKYSSEHRVAPELVFGIIERESSFRVHAKSSVGAKGLMQVLPVWHQDKIMREGGNNDLLWDPKFNIKIGTEIVREMLNRSKGNMHEALARYNGSLGMNNGYPEKVLKSKEQYRSLVREVRLSEYLSNS